MTERNLYLNPDPSMAGKPCQPSNSTDGMSFMELFCEKCKKDDYFRGGEELRCDILSKSFVYRTGDSEYPEQWTHRADGQPTCTAFEEEK